MATSPVADASEASTKPPSQRTRHLQRVLNGAIAGAVSKTVVSPLERVRLIAQTTSPELSSADGARAVLAREGWLGMWRGNGLSVARAAASKAILFSSQDGLRVILGNDFLAGSVAGVGATLATYPLDLLRTRAAGSVSATGVSIIATARSIMREGGALALFRGVHATLLGAVAFEGTRFGTYGWLRDRSSDHWLAPALNGTLASLVAGMVLYPNDTIRRRLQYESRPLGYMDALRELLREGGVHRLYRGCWLYCLKSVPGAAVQFGVYHGLKRLTGDHERPKRARG